MKQVIQNITTQAKINDAIVGRLLDLERRVAEIAAMRGESANVGNTRRAELPASSRQVTPSGNEPSTTVAMTSPWQDCLPMYLGQSIALCRVMKSFLMYVDTRDTYITPPLLISGICEPVETRFVMQKVKAGMTVADVGANCGYYTLLMAAAAGPTGRVYAFEPDPRNLELLDRNLQVNGLTERVTLIRQAALDQKKSVELYQSSRNSGAHSLFPANAENPSPKKLRGRAVPLDEAIDGRVDFVKIDAEGSEPFILRGMEKIASRSPHLQILMEFNRRALSSAGMRPEEFLRELKDCGYALSSLTPQSTPIAASEAHLLCEPISTLLLTRNGDGREPGCDTP